MRGLTHFITWAARLVLLVLLQTNTTRHTSAIAEIKVAMSSSSSLLLLLCCHLPDDLDDDDQDDRIIVFLFLIATCSTS